MRTRLLCGLLLTAAPAVASAQATSAADYMTKAGQSDQFEIQEGQLAQQMGSSAAVKRFGAQMVADHMKSTKMVMAAAMKSGLPTPSAPPPLRPDQQQMLDALKSAGGASFDQTYISQQKAAHEEALTLQSGYAKDGDDNNLKAAAAKITPVVKTHIAMLEKMHGGGAMSHR